MATFLDLIEEPNPLSSGTGHWVVDDQSWLGSAFGTSDADSITLDGAAVLAAFPDGVIPSGTLLGKITATGKYGPYSGTGEVSATEVQSITVSGATGGVVTLSFNGETTGPLAYNATAADVQAALNALDATGAAVVCTNGPLNTSAVTVTFPAGENVPQITIDATNLTPSGGTGKLATPVVTGTTTATTGGSLVAGTYGYRVSATLSNGETIPAATKTQVVPAGTSTNTVTVNWGLVTGATGYRVYGRVAGQEQLIAALGSVATFTDTGAVIPSGFPPTQNNTSTANATATATTTTQGNRAALTNGQQTAAGFLFTVKDVTPRNITTPQDVSAALLWHGEVVESKLPPGSGIDAAAKTALANMFRFV